MNQQKKSLGQKIVSTTMGERDEPCDGDCAGNPIYKDAHIKKRGENEPILRRKEDFCGAFYHVDKRPEKPGKSIRQFFCLNRDKCIIFLRENKERSPPIKVVAVAKFETDDSGSKPLYEARYTNCISSSPSIKMHAEEFFREDVDRNDEELANLINKNPGGTITIYLTLQPCNFSTTTNPKGKIGTWPYHSCCKTLRDIYIDKLRGKKVNLCVKPTHLCYLDKVEDTDAGDDTDYVTHEVVQKHQENEHFRKNAVRGIKMLMRNGITVSKMETADWEYLLSMTEPVDQGSIVDVEGRRKILDDEIGDILEKIRQQLHQGNNNQTSSQA